MSKISQQIVDQIKEEKITPKPRWQFVLRNVLLITAVISAVVVGGVVMSLVFLKMGDLDWEYMSLGGERGLPPVFEVLPLLWITTLILVLLLAVWSFEQTESAYKVRPVWVVLGTVFLSAVLAGALYAVRGSDFLEEQLRMHVPVYDQMERGRAERFNLPGQGLLPGRVLSIDGQDGFSLQDPRENVWTVSVEKPSKAERALQMLRPGQMVLIVGKASGEGTFVAHDIRMKRGIFIKLKAMDNRRGMGSEMPPPPFSDQMSLEEQIER